MVWMTPILPYINDTEDNVMRILEACAGAGVRGIICFDMGLTLRQGNREYFYAALDRHFPGLRQRYVREYGNRYALSSPNGARLMALFRDFCQSHGMLWKPEDCFEFLNHFPRRQISMFDP